MSSLYYIDINDSSFVDPGNNGDRCGIDWGARRSLFPEIADTLESNSKGGVTIIY